MTRMRRSVAVLALLCWLGSLPSGDAVARQNSPAEWLAEGRKLIEANCGDCMSATREGLQKGLALVRRARATGKVDRVDSGVVLAEGLNTLRLVYDARNAAAERAAADEHNRLLEELLKLRPTDAAIVYLHVDSIVDPAARLEAFRRVVWLDPRHAAAHFAIGMMLNEQGRTSEAITALRLAVEFGNRGDAAAYGSELIDILTAAGRTRELEEIRDVIKKKSR